MLNSYYAKSRCSLLPGNPDSLLCQSGLPGTGKHNEHIPFVDPGGYGFTFSHFVIRYSNLFRPALARHTWMILLPM